jgi:hypothetical protein
MPIYEYECPEHGIIQYFTKTLHKPATVLCPVTIDKDKEIDIPCGIECEKIWSSFATLSDSKETVFFENPNTHEVRLAANQYDKNPNGFEKKEAKGLAGRLNLEKRLQTQDKNIDKAKHNAIQLEKNLLTKQRHDNIKANFNTVHQIVDEKTGEQTGTFTYDDATKDLMKKAMERSEKTKPRFKERPMIFQVNHNDKSNRGTKE